MKSLFALVAVVALAVSGCAATGGSQETAQSNDTYATTAWQP